MHDNIKISIIMSCFNEKNEEVKKSIDSILHQTHTYFEFLIALDDPNNNRLDDVLTSYAASDNRIIYVKNPTNYGLAKTLNNLINRSSSNYIARMDADDIAKPMRIEKELDFLLAKDLDLVGTNIEVINENDAIMYIYNSEINSNRLYKEYEIIHPTWLVKKDVYTSLGGYRLIEPVEDLDFMIRAKKAKFKFGIVDEILLSYRIRMNSISRNKELVQKYERYFLLDKDRNNTVFDEDELSKYVASLNIPEKEKINYSKSRQYYKKSTVARYQNKSLKRYFYYLNSLLCSKTARKFFYEKRIKAKL